MRSIVLAAALFGTNVAQTLSVDDTDPSISYWPPDGWHTYLETRFGYYNGTGTYANEKGHFASWTFNGTSIEYWSPTGMDNGPCRVTVDGRDEKIVTAYSATYGRAILLYQKSDLDPRVPHTIAITVIQETTVPNDCHLDYFVYTPVDTSSISPPSEKPKVSWKVIVGAIGGALVLIGAGVLYYFCCLKPKPSGHQDEPHSHVNSKLGPKSPPIYAEDMKPALAITGSGPSATSSTPDVLPVTADAAITEEARSSNHQLLRRSSGTIRRPRQPRVDEEAAHKNGGDLGSRALSLNPILPMRQRSEDMDFNEWAGASKE